MKAVTNAQSVSGKLGIPSSLKWGYLGVLFFMIGDGLEMGWLSPYLIDNGLTIQQSALLFTVYGIMLTISSWFSGVSVEMWGPKKTMTFGFLAFLAGTVMFLLFGIAENNYSVMLPTYAMRGFGYPLFAYSFLVWVTYRSPQDKLGTAVGWFWFVFTAGLNVVGAYYSSFIIPRIGELNTLWTSLIFIAIGGLLALVINRDRFERKRDPHEEGGFKKLWSGITIVFEYPKVGMGGIVRMINTTAVFGFVVFLPTYMIDRIGFTQSVWLQIYGTLFLSNIIFNLIFGVVGDKLGWRNTVMWFGGVGCGLMTLALYYVPLWVGPDYWIMTGVAVIFGALLAAYVPLSALIPSLAPDKKGPTMGILNLGAGLSAFVGPALVGAFINILHAGGLMWLFAILYFISAFITKFITLPKTEETAGTERAVSNSHQQLDTIHS
ncbi:MFS transporter [Paenibacillus sp. GCM10027626]|uniref:MFS transporter n=1 Tax=Paenibacillus sp. GCM10027626 TaxID=3273411 RepID=UPI00363B1BEC